MLTGGQEMLLEPLSLKPWWGPGLQRNRAAVLVNVPGWLFAIARYGDVCMLRVDSNIGARRALSVGNCLPVLHQKKSSCHASRLGIT
jgi:hypothetical protein